MEKNDIIKCLIRYKDKESIIQAQIISIEDQSYILERPPIVKDYESDSITVLKESCTQYDIVKVNGEFFESIPHPDPPEKDATASVSPTVSPASIVEVLVASQAHENDKGKDDTKDDAKNDTKDESQGILGQQQENSTIVPASVLTPITTSQETTLSKSSTIDTRTTPAKNTGDQFQMNWAYTIAVPIIIVAIIVVKNMKK